MTSATSCVPLLPLPRPSPLQPAGELTRLRAAAALSRVTATSGEPAWLVTRYGEALAVLADRRFGLALPGVETVGDQTDDSLFQDPPGHTRLRRLVSAAFTPRRVARDARPAVRADRPRPVGDHPLNGPAGVLRRPRRHADRDRRGARGRILARRADPAGASPRPSRAVGCRRTDTPVNVLMITPSAIPGKAAGCAWSSRAAADLGASADRRG